MGRKKHRSQVSRPSGVRPTTQTRKPSRRTPLFVLPPFRTTPFSTALTAIIFPTGMCSLIIYRRVFSLFTKDDDMSQNIPWKCISRACTLLRLRPLSSIVACSTPRGWPPSHLPPDIWRRQHPASDHLILERLANRRQSWPGGVSGNERPQSAPAGEILWHHQEKSFSTTRINPSAPVHCHSL